MWSLFSYMVSVRPHVRPKKPKIVAARKIIYATKYTMRVNNDHLLAVAWWVTLKVFRRVVVLLLPELLTSYEFMTLLVCKCVY